MQSANEKISDPVGGQARAPSCDVTANDSKRVLCLGRSVAPRGKEAAVHSECCVVISEVNGVCYHSLAPRAPPSVTLQSDRAKPLLRFSCYTPHACTHTYIHTYMKNECMHARFYCIKWRHVEM